MNVNFVVDFNKPMYPCRQFLLKGDRQFDNVGLMSTLMTTFMNFYVGSIILSIVCSCPRKGKPGGGESMSEPDVESSSSAPASRPPYPARPILVPSHPETRAWQSTFLQQRIRTQLKDVGHWSSSYLHYQTLICDLGANLEVNIYRFLGDLWILFDISTQMLPEH